MSTGKAVFKAASGQVGAVVDRIKDAQARGLALAGEHVLGESRKIVPLEEGTLERSGRVSVDKDGGRAAVSYDTPYAVQQHEDLTLKHDQGREAKYLEKAVNGNRDVVKDIIARTLRGEF